jgi:hypothetical protein
LYAGDDAEFAFGQQMLGNLAKGYRGGVGMVKNAVGDVFTSGQGFKAGGDRVKNYFTREASNIRTGKAGRVMDWKRTGKAIGAVAGTGAAGYGAYRLGRAGLGVVGIGHKEEPKPWYRFGN